MKSKTATGHPLESFAKSKNTTDNPILLVAKVRDATEKYSKPVVYFQNVTGSLY